MFISSLFWCSMSANPYPLALELMWWCHTVYIHCVFLLELDIKTFLCIVSKRSYRSYRREHEVHNTKEWIFSSSAVKSFFCIPTKCNTCTMHTMLAELKRGCINSVMLSAKFSFQPRQCRAQCIWGAAEQTCLARWVARVVSMDPAPLPSSSTLHIFDTTQRLSSYQYYIRFF